jgi:hypothetical protein
VFCFYCSCTVSYPTYAKALAALKDLGQKIGKNGLVSVTEGKGMKQRLASDTDKEMNK